MLICNPELEKWRQGDLEFKMTLSYTISWRAVQGSGERQRETGDGERRETGRDGENGTRVHYVKQNNPGSERQISLFLTHSESRFKSKEGGGRKRVYLREEKG